MKEIVTELFMKCVYVLQVIGGTPGEYGFGYYLANIVIFVVIEPLLICTFLILWLRALKKLNTKEK